MNNINKPNEQRFTLHYNGKHYLSFSESELLEEGVPQSEVDKVKVAQIQDKRQKAYKEESDPLYMEWQYDQTPESEQAWRDKVVEIKARYPLPVEA
ncbi:hypothetical protein L1D31_21645 [Vibrio sp. Isolate23]|uniref:hypothetical protein n=1 Tax=Vibrio sp. Isolate23 TaxID=2908533 RepID=UPI001EFCB4D6|nr:hypothetical protein [Vibrio sp. Isolate23]MCG9685129.1 hypothetical protein [Vibrio sp. Isolate23]